MKKLTANHEQIDKLIEDEMSKPPQLFPYTTAEVAERVGVSKITAYNAMLASPLLVRRGRRWAYRHNGGHE